MKIYISSLKVIRQDIEYSIEENQKFAVVWKECFNILKTKLDKKLYEVQSSTEMMNIKWENKR